MADQPDTAKNSSEEPAAEQEQERRQDWMDDLQICLGFLTLTPVLGGPAVNNPSLAEASRFFPVVGILLGAIAVFVLVGAQTLGIPQSAAILLALLSITLISGGLHEDGLADTADGLGGGFDKERSLEIMLDSRIGSFGVLALIFCVGLKWAGLGSLPEHGAALALFGAIVASRGVLPIFMRYVPPAKEDGLSAGAGQPEFDRAIVSAGITLIVLFFVFGFWASLLIIVATAVVTGLFVWWVRRKIGGQTGDILGAVQQISEVTIILMAAAAGAV